jgi:hypothetical protein
LLSHSSNEKKKKEKADESRQKFKSDY